jgi:mono/diheme cytochrome c family protein
MRKYFLLLFIATSSVLLVAQEKIKKTPAPYTSPASGKEMYMNYCASCHGKSGKGDGPAAGALKQPPTDLTTLARMNGGKFPADHVMAVLNAKTEVTAHGSKDMPVWGRVFWTMSEGHSSIVQLRITNLSNYLESIQAK